MTDIHSCSHYCDRPECVRRQRDELRDSAFKSREGWACPETYALTLDAVKAEAKHSAELAAEVDRLRKDADRWRDITAGLDAEQVVAASVKFGDALGVLKDAERYRALRFAYLAQSPKWAHIIKQVPVYNQHTFDAAIDAAMKEPDK